MSSTRQIALIVSLTLIGLITHSTYAGTGDEPHYLAIAHSIAFWNDADGVAAVCSRGGATFCSVLPSFVTAGDRAGQAP